MQGSCSIAAEVSVQSDFLLVNQELVSIYEHPNSNQLEEKEPENKGSHIVGRWSKCKATEEP